MEDNPFAPPTASEPPTEGGLVFSPAGAEVVASLSKWMRVLAIIYYIGAGLFVLAGFFMAIGAGLGAYGFGMLIGVAVFALAIGLAGSWLSSAGSDFERGVLTDDEVPLGSGFRSLRAYFILMGIVGVLSFGSQLYTSLSRL